jgi:hypothetical protein
LIGSVPGIVFGSYLATRARDGVVQMALASILVTVGVRLLSWPKFFDGPSAQQLILRRIAQHR